MNHPTQTALYTHRNHYLFSDYYLANRLREQPEWAAAVSEALTDFTALWRGYQPQADNESQTEADWIRPALTKLGHTFNVQVALTTPFGTRKPDYILYPDEAARQAAKVVAGALTADHFRDNALVVADAKAWGRDLDRAAASPARNKGLILSDNPMLQIYVYVQHSGLPWGIVTNGKVWRLVHRSRADKLEVYYEVDLPALIEQGDANAFKFFYLFFRREAFIAPPGQRSFLERVLQQSQVYNRGISDNLKEQVYEALRFLAQGFLDFPPNQLDARPDALRDIYIHSLIVLYRLLFILYAESRALLPVAGPQRNRLYSDSYSLDALKRRIARDLDQRKPVAASMASDWHVLRQLWRVIDQGNPDLDVPAYNGGLFSESSNDFLARYRVGDKHLRQAIDLLARTDDPQTKERRFVDYRDLEIRHLGSIYEGLLEYQLRRAEQPLRVRLEKGRELYEPVQTAEVLEPSAVYVAPGEVYLVTDKGERKATGSYYTPDYIVEYIVAQTIGPALEALRQCHAEDPAALERAILGVNVLDPSMGSGHFLVEATNFIALQLVELALPKPPDAEFESDLAYWRRRVVQACIYGVDVNPLAVELAKLSLWLTTVARGKPLSFLDHHLRHGNSLIGSRVAEVPLAGAARQNRRRQQRRQKVEAAQRAAGQLSMLDDSAFVGAIRTATGFMDSIERLRGETLAEVQEAADLYQKTVTEVTAKVRQLADIWTARAFGLELSDELWAPLARYLTHGGLPFAKLDQLVTETETLVRQHHFFHWELAFPEVFFDEHGRLDPAAGFDAVIGNPPYVRQEELSSLKSWFKQAFPEVYHGVADLYVYFLGQGLKLLRKDGRLGYITSGTFQKLNFGANLRKFLTTQSTLETVIDFGDEQVFYEALTYPIILITKNRSPSSKDTLSVLTPEVLKSSTEIRNQNYVLSKSERQWVFVNIKLKHILEGWQGSTSLREILDKPVYRGVSTGSNKAFVIDEKIRKQLILNDDKSQEIIKPYIRGQDLQPWYQENNGLYLIFARRGTNIDRYPAIKEYLQKYREQLEPRPQDWNKKKKWPGRKPGLYEWYEIQDTVGYFEVFERPRIHSTKVSLYPSFSLLTEVMYGANTSYVIPLPNGNIGYYLLAVLNSRVSEYYGRKVFAQKANGYFEIQPKRLEDFPIPDAPSAEQEAIGELAMQLTDIAKSRYQLHRQSRHRIVSDLRTPEGKDRLNQKLTAWWDLDFAVFRREIKKVFKQDIPLNERDEWESWLVNRQEKHRQHTQEIIRLETVLNGRVYALFNLTPAEIVLIEDSTKYRYGEV